MKKLLSVLVLIGMIVSVSSCSTTESCWAYRDVHGSKAKKSNYKSASRSARMEYRMRGLKWN